MNSYKKIVFIDSNIVLEAKPLVELPWEEIDAAGPILVLVVPQVLKEVDSKKRDGRLATRAREFNRLMGLMLDNGGLESLRRSNPRVEISFAVCGKISWDAYDDLDPNEGDCRVVAEVLNTQSTDLDKCILISQDIAPLLLASRRNVKIFRAHGNWLAAPEPSPQEKEIARLKRQLSDYSKNEPQFEIKIDVDEKAKIYKVESFESEEYMDMILRVQELNPRIEQTPSSFSISSSIDYDVRYEKRYDDFISRIPELVEKIPQKLELTYGQIPFSIALVNCGKVRAENLHVEVQVVGGWMNRRPILGGSFPRAPKPERRNLIPNIHTSQHIRQREIGRHEVDVIGFERSANFVAQCADFRQGQEWNLNAVIWLDPGISDPAKVIVTITAANLHGAVNAVKSVEKEIVQVAPHDLLDKSKGQLKGQSYVRSFIETAINERRYSDFETDKDG